MVHITKNTLSALALGSFLFSSLVFSQPQTAQASILSILGLGTDVSAETLSVKTSNSQKVGLLEANLGTSITVKGETDTTPDMTLINDGTAMIPQMGPLGTDADAEEIPSLEDSAVYVVRSGDTVSGIAKMFGVDSATILLANGLAPGEKPKVGDTLLILPISGIEYSVQKGDTIASIAKKFQVDAIDIIEANEVNENEKLTVGDKLLIPNATVPQAPGKPKKPSNTTTTVSGPTRGTVGYFIRPIRGGIRTQGRHGKIARNAVDIGAPVGTPVLAAADGIVLIQKNNGAWNAGMGNYVIIQHTNGSKSYSEHLSTTTVSNGQQVKQGDTIGYVGMTGHTTGPHLHWEVSRGYENPLIKNPRYGL